MQEVLEDKYCSTTEVLLLMSRILNFCETFRILEEVIKHGVEKESANHEESLHFFWSIYLFFFFCNLLICTK